jgi:hypothetical protein
MDRVLKKKFSGERKDLEVCNSFEECMYSTRICKHIVGQLVRVFKCACKISENVREMWPSTSKPRFAFPELHKDVAGQIWHACWIAHGKYFLFKRIR